jgi:hypothetical protein
MNDRDQLQIRINRLTVQMPRLQREYPHPADFWPAFAGNADPIIDDRARPYYEHKLAA